MTKYSMFMASLLDNKYSWFQKDLLNSGQLNQILVPEENLEAMIGFFRTACVKNDIKKPVIVSFLDFLVNSKDLLCSDQNKNQDPLIDSLEQQKKFEMFIERFFNSLQNSNFLADSEVFEA